MKIAKDGLYQVLVNNTILYTILAENMQNYIILYTNTIPNQNNGFQMLINTKHLFKHQIDL
jgi:hypothetical protein